MILIYIMSYLCDNIYSTCNSIFINIAWFANQVVIDLNDIREDFNSYYDENVQMESQGRRRLRNAGLLKPYKYDEIEEYIGDEDWLEPWDKV